MIPRFRWIRRQQPASVADIIPSLLEELKKTRPSVRPSQARLLAARGIDSPEKIRRFLAEYESFSAADFMDPFLVPDMDKAVDRVARAVESAESVLLFGDYDVDGITSIAILHHFLRRYAPKCGLAYYQPDRFSEGYGFSREGVEAAKAGDLGATLIITVDCGITNLDAVRYAAENGIDVVIIDHHEPHAELPAAAAVVDPKRHEFQGPFRDWAGAGVAFLFTLAFAQRRPDLCPGFKFAPYAELAALGTVADIVPLTGGNRTLVKAGFHILDNDFGKGKGLNLGLRLLRRISRSLDKPVTSRTVSFVIGPRLNAAGRVDVARKATDLLLSGNEDEAATLADELDRLNTRRKKTQGETYEVLSRVLGQPAGYADRLIVHDDPDLDEGVRGIVASKVARAYNRPVLLFTADRETGFYTGSGRSVEGFDLYELLQRFEKYFEKWGGHRQAAGLTLTKEKYPEFKREILAYANRALGPETLKPSLTVDADIGCEEITQEYAEFLDLLEPFGEMNPPPQLLLENVRILGIERQCFSNGGGSKNFLKFEVLSPDESFRRTLTLWDPDDLFDDTRPAVLEKILKGKSADFIVALSASERNGRIWVNANVADLEVKS